MQYKELTIKAKGRCYVSGEELYEALHGALGPMDIEVTVHQPLDLSMFADKPVPGLAAACRDEVLHWENYGNTTGVADVCNTDSPRELAQKVFGILEDNMDVKKAVKLTNELIQHGIKSAGGYAPDMDILGAYEAVTLDGLLDRLAGLKDYEVLNFALDEDLNFAACFMELFEAPMLSIGYWGGHLPLMLCVGQQEIKGCESLRNTIREYMEGFMRNPATVYLKPERHRLTIAYAKAEG